MGVSPVAIATAGGGTGLKREISIGGLGGNVKLKDLAVMAGRWRP